MKALVLALLLTLGAGACKAQTDRVITVPGHADEWVPMTMPEGYPGYWEQNLICLNQVYGFGGSGAGTVRPTPFTTLAQLTFFTAGDSNFTDRNGKLVYGEFFPPDTIVVATALKDHPKLVRHEMLHAMGVMYHPIIPFVECGLWNVKPGENTLPYPVTGGALSHGQ